MERRTISDFVSVGASTVNNGRSCGKIIPADCLFLFPNFGNTPVNPTILMSDSSLRFDSKVVAVSSPAGVSDAVWSYVTSLKQVTKRSGISEPFQPEKIQRSVAAAMIGAGIKDQKIIDKVIKTAVSRLQRSFDGHTQPTTLDIREMISVSMIDLNLIHAAKKYANYHIDSLNKRDGQEPVYGHGLEVKNYFTEKGVHPYNKISWELRDARIANEKGKIVFEQIGVEMPNFWSQTATNIVVSKYFRGQVGKDDREQSVRQLIDRVAKTISNWGRKDGYFQSEVDAETYENELTHILVNQMAAFNSPVWFNVGVASHPQCSACFINSVQDDMRSILNLAVTEGMLFKGGSGTGTNISNLRSSKEYLAGSNGKASGPVSFMKGLDAFAGVIKSGGKTRRAAKMVILNVDHPDIEEFVTCKVEEEKKAWALIDAGYDGSLDGPAYGSIYFQNANNSVRVNDDFMKAVIEDKDWTTKEVISGAPSVTYKAKDLMGKICEAAWQCGDPGFQYDTTINKWHTCKGSGRINASNPCVTGDTMVATERGWERIDSLLAAPTKVLGSDGVYHEIAPAFKTGTKAVYRLITESGFELKLTADHRVLTKNRGDVAAIDLQDEDIVTLVKPAFGQEKLDSRLAEFLGVMVGDGCLSGEQETAIVTLAPEEKVVAEFLHKNLSSFKQDFAADGRACRDTEVTQPQETLRFGTSARCVVDELKKMAVLDKGSENKIFKDSVFLLNKESLSAVLRGLFTADGSVANYGDKTQYVSLDSTSLKLLQQTQLLLLAFGIKAKIYKNRRIFGQKTALMPDGQGGQKEYPVQQIHSLRVSRSSRVLFQEQIGFCEGSVKQEKLTVMNEKISTYEDLFEEQIERLDYLGEEAVFDLTESVTNHFAANGLLVHNCSEYMFLDDSACNLASLNLMKFRKEVNGLMEFDVEAFKHANEIIITAMEIIIGNSSYPTPSIEENSLTFRPLGIGFANLGALLMSQGLAYTSDQGRNLAAIITSMQSGVCYAQSTRIAEKKGPFAAYQENSESVLDVMRMHRDATEKIPLLGVSSELLAAAREAWHEVVERGARYGLRNAQISVLAPTGTIAFLMDCDTTGVEPDIALVKYKWLVGGGMIKIVNNTVPEALTRLGYSDDQKKEILDYISEKDTIEGASHVKEDHLEVFDCAFRPANGKRSIQYMGHLRMMAAVQPYLSGAISKTVNMPNESTPADIEKVYVEAWKMGIKAVAVYRDGSKRQQPLTTSLDKDQSKKVVPATKKSEVAVGDGRGESIKPLRRRLPDERRAITHKFQVGTYKGYITVGLYDDGTPGELFVTMSKEGSVISGLADAFSTSVSIGLQYGVPLQVLVNKFVHMRFEPSGYTNNPNIRIAKSLIDYIFRWMAMKFMTPEEQRAVGIMNVVEPEAGINSAEPVDNAPVKTNEAEPQPTLFNEKKASLTSTFDNQSDAPVCSTCGSIMVRNASCYKCLNCGATSGCS